MADLSAFNSDSFNVVAWIDNAFKEKSEDESLESYLASLSMKLHIISQDYSDQLETAMIDGISTVPRIQSEILRLDEILEVIESEMSDLSGQLQQFDQKNVVGIEDLSRLDMLKTNMENCKSTLEEHARWSQLVREAKTFLEGGGRLSDSADRIEIMYRSLEILKNISGHEERQETYQQLRDTLINAMKPHLLMDIAGNNLSQLQEYLYVYDKLGKRREFEEEYVTARVKRLLDSWLSPSVEVFHVFLSKFLQDFLELLEAESVDILDLFVDKDNCLNILNSLVSSSLSSMAESFVERLQGAKSAQVALESYLVLENFSKKVLQFIDVSNLLGLSDILRAIFGGCLLFLDQYVDIESQTLARELNDITDGINFSQISSEFSSVDGSIDEDPYESYVAFSERLVQAAEDFAGPFKRSLRRSAVFMGGLKSKQVFRAASSTLAGFVKQLIRKIDFLRVACGAPPDGPESSSGPAEAWARKLEVFDIGSKPLIQCAFRALQSTGRLTKQIREVEGFAIALMNQLLGSLFRDITLDKQITTIISPSSSDGASVGLTLASYILQGDFTLSSELKSFLTASTSTHASHSIFTNVYTPLFKCKAVAGSLLLDLMTSIPEKGLAEMSQDEAWSSPLEASLDQLLPQPFFTQVGEHLLSLVQELEIFASSEARPDLAMLIGDASSMIINSRGWKQLKTTLDLTNETEALEALCKRSACASAIVAAERSLFGTALSRFDDFENQQLPTTSSQPLVDDEAITTAFVNEWLGAISDAIVGLVLVQIVKIAKLTSYGRLQLIVDLDYLGNVIHAVGLKQHPLLTHVNHLLSQENVATSANIEGLSVRGNNSSAAFAKFDVLVLTAIKRGY